MDEAIWGFIGTLVGTCFGAGASIATTFWTTRSAALLQSTSATNERLERNREFQKATLIELQEALHDEIRAAAQVYLADTEAFLESGIWGKNLLGEELNSSFHLAGRRTYLLTERVASDELRLHIQKLRKAIVNAATAPDRVQAELLHIESVEVGSAVLEHLGAVLRSQYPEPPTSHSIK